MKARSISLMLCAMLLLGFIAGAADIPFLTGRVTDNAHILSEETQKTLTDSLKITDAHDKSGCRPDDTNTGRRKYRIMRTGFLMNGSLVRKRRTTAY